MAKRKSSKSTENAIASPSRSERLSTSIDGAENGYVINVSGETKNGGYFSKRYVASDRPEALRIASSCLAGSHTKVTKKKGMKGKRITSKKI